MHWHDDIPKTEKGNSLTLIRTPRSGKLAGIVTSEAVTGKYTHYWGGHTVPCEDEDCEACKQGVGNRWHGYLGIYFLKTGQHCIFEFTAKAAEPLKDYVALTGKLRGCGLVAERRGPKGNAPVILQCKPVDLSSIRLPDPPDLKKILAMIWGIPETAVMPNGAAHYSELLGIDQNVMDKVRGPTEDRKARRKRSA